MKFEKFLNDHWEVFLRHICEFHPLGFDFLAKYEYEIDWKSLSKNRKIEWNEEFLERYENRFLWHELAWNDSIIWDTPLIKRFNKRLDWYYLGRNKSLPISEEFIKVHKKKMFIIESNVHLTPELIKIYGKNLLPRLSHVKKELSKKQLRNLENTLLAERASAKSTYLNLYTRYIVPNLKRYTIEEIFADKFNYTQRYYKIQPINNDIFGLTPEFEFEGENIFDEHREGRGLFEISKKIILKNGSLQEGKPRLYEVPRFSGVSFYPILIVSENIKRVIERFKISSHKFIPVTIKPKKIKTDLNFYFLQIEYDSLLKECDFSELQFTRLAKKDYFSQFHRKTYNKGEIESYESLPELIEKSNSEGNQLTNFVPDEYSTTADIDIFTIDRDIIVNEFVKEAIEKVLPNQVDFKSVQLLDIRIPQEIYDNKADKTEEKSISIKESNTKLSEELVFYYEKKKRLEHEEYEPDLSIPDDEFYTIQKKLNIIIPDSFKSKYRNNQLDSEEFELLKLSEFYIQNEYSETVPETYKSLIVAENGLGDSLGLILKKDDDFKLRDELYEFNHETGEVEIY
jgi:hypothetical protein